MWVSFAFHWWAVTVLLLVQTYCSWCGFPEDVVAHARAVSWNYGSDFTRFHCLQIRVFRRPGTSVEDLTHLCSRSHEFDKCMCVMCVIMYVVNAGTTNWFNFSTPLLCELVCLFLMHNHARASAHAKHVLVFVVWRLSVGNCLDKN